MAISFCAIGSGSKGNAYLVAGNNSRILIDAGFSAKYIAENLNAIGVAPNEIDGIVVTHEHIDHIGGINVFSKRFDIPVYANEKTMLEILRKCKDISQKNVRVFKTGEDFYINDLNIAPFKTPHDSASSCGYSVFCGNVKVTVATDLGHMTKNVLEGLKGADLIVLESNHDLNMLYNGPYPESLKQRVSGPNGHLSNDACGQTLAYLADFGLKHIILGHLSEENNTPEIAYKSACEYLNEKGVEVNKDIGLEIASQSVRGKCYRIE